MKHHFFNHFVSMSDEYFQNLCKWVFEVLIIVNSLLLKVCTSARAFRYSLKCLLFYGLNFSFISSLSFPCRPHHTRTTLHIHLQIIQLFLNILFSSIPYILPPPPLRFKSIIWDHCQLNVNWNPHFQKLHRKNGVFLDLRPFFPATCMYKKTY